jgi:hypothetical protein
MEVWSLRRRSSKPAVPWADNHPAEFRGREVHVVHLRESMARTLGLIGSGAVVGFALGAALVLLATSVSPALANPGGVLDVRGGVLAVGTVAAVLGALIGMAGSVAAGWMPAEPQ